MPPRFKSVFLGDLSIPSVPRHDSLLGTGAFGAVYLLQVPHYGADKVAVKRMHSTIGEELAQHEIAILSILQGQSCKSYYPCLLDYFRGSDAAFYIVTKYAAGSDLRDVNIDSLFRGGGGSGGSGGGGSGGDSVPGAMKVRRFAASFAQAVQVLHKNGIAHNDIKPPNIKVNFDVYPPEFVLLDFGVSCLFVKDSKSPTRKQRLEQYSATVFDAIRESRKSCAPLASSPNSPAARLDNVEKYQCSPKALGTTYYMSPSRRNMQKTKPRVPYSDDMVENVLLQSDTWAMAVSLWEFIMGESNFWKTSDVPASAVQVHEFVRYNLFGLMSRYASVDPVLCHVLVYILSKPYVDGERKPFYSNAIPAPLVNRIDAQLPNFYKVLYEEKMQGTSERLGPKLVKKPLGSGKVPSVEATLVVSRSSSSFKKSSAPLFGSMTLPPSPPSAKSKGASSASTKSPSPKKRKL